MLCRNDTCLLRGNNIVNMHRRCIALLSSCTTINLLCGFSKQVRHIKIDDKPKEKLIRLVIDRNRSFVGFGHEILKNHPNQKPAKVYSHEKVINVMSGKFEKAKV